MDERPTGLEYAGDKLAEAVHILDAGEFGKQRLWEPYQCFCAVMVKDFPPKLVAQFKGIQAALTHSDADTVRVPWAIANMTQAGRERVADRIRRLAHDVAAMFPDEDE